MSQDDNTTDKSHLRLVDTSSNKPAPLRTEADLAGLVDSLSAEQLRQLNRLTCDRLTYLSALEELRAMHRFLPGEIVTFEDKQGVWQTGTVIKRNRKTISVMNESGKKWNVSPSYLSHHVPNTVDINNYSSKEYPAHSVWHWTASRIAFPGMVSSEEEFFIPEMIIWMDGDQLVRRLDLIEPSDGPERITNSFRQAIEQPSVGDPGAPVTVRTDRKDVIHLLSPLYPDTHFLYSDVPEIKAMATDLAAAITSDDNDSIALDHSTNSNVMLETVAAFYKASAELYRCAPWKLITRDSQLIGLHAPSINLNDHVISVIGQQEDTFGIVLHDSTTAYDRYLRLITTSDPKAFNDIPAHSALYYIPAKELSPVRRKQAMERGWTVANSNAHPDLFLAIGNGIAREPNHQDFITFTVIAQALIKLCEAHKTIDKHWQTDKPLDYRTQVKSTRDAVDVTFSVPALPPGKTQNTLNLWDQLSLLDKTNFPNIEDRHYELSEAISRAYEESPEAKSVEEPGAGHTLLMQFSFNYHGYTVALLNRERLNDILYELFPRKVMMPDSDAHLVIEDIRAFLRFLKREYQFEGASDLLPLVTKAAVKRMKNALSDSSKFGLSKSLFSGADSPFPKLDISEETDPEFIKGEIQKRLDSGYFDETLPPTDLNEFTSPTPIKALSSTEKKKRKQKRKNSRNSRQRNR